ncbi:MTRF1L release factor glutamine methyltransferase isoform X2 [Rhinoraja longicauda]
MSLPKPRAAQLIAQEQQHHKDSRPSWFTESARRMNGMLGRCAFRSLLTGCGLRLASRAAMQSLAHNGTEGVVCLSTASPWNLCSSAPVTAASSVTHWREVFEQKGISEPLLSAEHIVSHVLGGKTIHSLGAEALTRLLTGSQKQIIWDLCARRLEHMPIQYVIEEWDFRDLTLKIKPPVFIPRPETESLAMAVDKSPEAVKLTRENAERLGVLHRLRELQLNVISDACELIRVCGAVDVIVSNPPYVFHEDMAGLMPDILRYEDHDALNGGVDGMDVIRAILNLASKVLKDNGKVFLEVDPRHPVMIENWLQEYPKLQLSYQATHQDLYGKQRFCILQRK